MPHFCCRILILTIFTSGSLIFPSRAKVGLADTLIPFPLPNPLANHSSDLGLGTKQDSAPSGSHGIPTPLINRPNVAAQGTLSTENPSVEPLKRFFIAYDSKNASRILQAKAELSFALDKAIAAWMIATTSTRNFSYQTLIENATTLVGWPGVSTMELARERTLVRRAKPAAWVVDALPDRPQTDEGKILQLKSLIAAKANDKAARKLRAYWVNENFSQSHETTILRDLGPLLRQQDHEARVTRLLYDERANAALRLTSKLSDKAQALMAARIAVIRKQKEAPALLDALPRASKRDPAYFLARIQNLRRADQWLDAGKVMLEAPRNPAKLVDLREWWIERRMVSRKVLEAGHPHLAYQIVAQFSTDRVVDQIDAHFHAGWYALRFIKDAKTALHHFEAMSTMSDKPISRARAFYWRARAYQELGRTNLAGQNYQQAGLFAHTYYGQLALRRLGQTSLALPPLPETKTASTRFDQRYFVQIIHRLNAAGQKGRTGIFFRHLAATLRDPAEITLLANLANRHKQFPIELQIGKTAVSNGVNVPRLAYPLGAIPWAAGISNQEKALVYAIARQESAFNVDAVSRADARGLMQLLPSTAKHTAKTLGVSYRPAQLTRDSVYNTKLGSAFLNQLIERFGGSYILAFAGYNAGPRRSAEWIERFGDPRQDAVDAVDWVEFIPFYETRNYVQRVLENFQVYHYRLENAPLTIETDLKRGNPHLSFSRN